jgi:hypothetical protein
MFYADDILSMILFAGVPRLRGSADTDNEPKPRKRGALAGPNGTGSFS